MNSQYSWLNMGHKLIRFLEVRMIYEAVLYISSWKVEFRVHLCIGDRCGRASVFPFQMIFNSIDQINIVIVIAVCPTGTACGVWFIHLCANASTYHVCTQMQLSSCPEHWLMVFVLETVAKDLQCIDASAREYGTIIVAIRRRKYY